MRDDYIHTRTHLGYLLRAGDSVMGLDLRNSNINNDELDKLDANKLPDVVSRTCLVVVHFEIGL